MAGAHAKPGIITRIAAWTVIAARFLFITAPADIWEGLQAAWQGARHRLHSLVAHTPQHKAAAYEEIPGTAATTGDTATWDALPTEGPLFTAPWPGAPSTHV
jgi:hypothetical protein